MYQFYHYIPAKRIEQYICTNHILHGFSVLFPVAFFRRFFPPLFFATFFRIILISLRIYAIIESLSDKNAQNPERPFRPVAQGHIIIYSSIRSIRGANYYNCIIVMLCLPHDNIGRPITSSHVMS